MGTFLLFPPPENSYTRILIVHDARESQKIHDQHKI